MKMRVSRLDTNAINAAMEANERGSLRASTIVSARSAAGTFSVQHDLSDVPDDFLYSRVDNVDVYATSAQRAAWSDTSCELTGSAAGDVRVWFVRVL